MRTMLREIEGPSDRLKAMAGVAGVLYAIALFLPSLERCSSYGTYQSCSADGQATGFALMSSGWMATVFAISRPIDVSVTALGWYANLFWLWSMVRLCQGRAPAPWMTLLTLALALCSLGTMQVCFMTCNAMRGGGPGFWLWLAAMAVPVARTLAFWLREHTVTFDG